MTPLPARSGQWAGAPRGLTCLPEPRRSPANAVLSLGVLGTLGLAVSWPGDSETVTGD